VLITKKKNSLDNVGDELHDKNVLCERFPRKKFASLEEGRPCEHSQELYDHS
jgi:hypothetical protein